MTKPKIAGFRLACQVWAEDGAEGLEEHGFKRRTLLAALRACVDEGDPAAKGLGAYLEATRTGRGGRPRADILKARRPYRGHGTASVVEVRVDEIAAAGEGVADRGWSAGSSSAARASERFGRLAKRTAS